MTDDLYPSFGMKRSILSLCSDKRLSVIGTGAAISGNPHSAPLYISLGTKKPSSDTEMEKSLVESPLFFGPLSIPCWNKRSAGSNFLDVVGLTSVAQHSVGGV